MKINFRTKNRLFQLWSKKIGGQAFTLIEVIVSLSIMSILVTVFLANYRGADRQAELGFSAQRLVTIIRTAQNNTLGSVEYNGQVPAGGWGFHLDISSSTDDFYIFADLDQDLEMDADEYDVAYGGRRVSLPDGVFLASTTMGDILDITFTPPDPITNIWNGSSTSTNVRIQLENSNGSRKRVGINFLGLIEAID
jgi:prepilin-type N-terminal cleavage/methylation domain-containing protein